MARVTGKYQITTIGGEKVRAFIPHVLPPASPALRLTGSIAALHAEALSAIGKLEVAGEMVPNSDWFLYGFIRKEAVISSQIEGTQATLEDVVSFEATRQSEHPADIEEVCNYVKALMYAQDELAKPNGLPLCSRLLCNIHKRLLSGTRGGNKQPGKIRSSQNWIGGTRPGNARFVPPPPTFLHDAIGALEQWIHKDDSLPPLVRAGVAHVQFETIHPFLDGNGRVGRILIMILLQRWKLLTQPFLYLSLAFKRHQSEYYKCLDAVRTDGDWERWTAFFLRCVCETADDGVNAARRIFSVIDEDRNAMLAHKATTVTAMRLLNLLPNHPIVTLSYAIELLNATKPTAAKAIDALIQSGILHEVSGKKRGRIYAYRAYLDILIKDTGLIPE